MSFDDVGKRFEQKKYALIRLECENCGQSPDDVRTVRPCWFDNRQDVCLCSACYVSKLHELIKTRKVSVEINPLNSQ
jgi:hypothetical protein